VVLFYPALAFSPICFFKYYGGRLTLKNEMRVRQWRHNKNYNFAGEVYMKLKLISTLVLAGLGLASNHVWAACSDVDRAALATIAGNVVDGNNGGLGFPMWVTVVDETGKVCHVINSNGEGNNSNAAWLGSRIISAQKANAANAFSHDGLSLSTANLYSAVQPGGSLYGLQHSNPVDASRAYRGNPSKYGTTNDPIKGLRIGGVNVFGGGLALYVDDNGNETGGIRKVGAIGVSGDTSCTDHVVAWKIRTQLGLDHVPGGVANGGANDALIQDISGGSSASGWGHPTCVNNPTNTNDGSSIEGNDPA
jgi:uncharacterized protein GlcG (DUF336 family)